MANTPSKQLYNIPLEMRSGNTRNVKVKAASREAAERRALKFNPAARGVKR